MVLAGADFCEGKDRMAKVVAWAQAGVDPKYMGLGPIPAVKRALEKAGWQMEGVDLFELNEAFASQSLACVQELGLDPSKVGREIEREGEVASAQ